MVDKLRVPHETGEYVLSFRIVRPFARPCCAVAAALSQVFALRQDCEQTSQVWNQCADVRIV